MSIVEATRTTASAGASVGPRVDVPGPSRLRASCGRTFPLSVDRWWVEPAREEHEVLRLALPATLDLGCGPARHTLALMRAGVPTLGVDNAAPVVRAAQRRGAQVLHRSLFERLPGEGTWGTALLLDGNVGIGGDPDALFTRVRRLVRPGGRVLVEVEPPGVCTERLQVRAEHEDQVVTGWFPWARVGADHVRGLAERSGFRLMDLWSESGRWFGRLDAR